MVSRYIYKYTWGFPEIGGTPSLHFYGIFPYKSSIVGYPHDYGNHHIDSGSRKQSYFYITVWFLDIYKPYSSIYKIVGKSRYLPICISINGGVLKWGYPNSWSVYKGKSPSKIEDFGIFGGTTISGNNQYPTNTHRFCRGW